MKIEDARIGQRVIYGRLPDAPSETTGTIVIIAGELNLIAVQEEGAGGYGSAQLLRPERITLASQLVLQVWSPVSQRWQTVEPGDAAERIEDALLIQAMCTQGRLLRVVPQDIAEASRP